MTTRSKGILLEAFLGEVLDCVAQPVWVVDHDGVILFANPAASAALGYERTEDLLGKPSHETIHYKHPDGSHFPVEECPMLRPRQTGETISVDEDWFVRPDGSMFPVAYTSAPLELESGRGAVVAFTDIEERRKHEQALRERDIAEARATELAAARSRVIEAADAERRRVTRDLHDGAQQDLVTVITNLQLARQSWPEPERARELLDFALQAADRGLRGLRELAAGMHPAILTTRGLAAALESLSHRMPLPVEFAELPSRRLDAKVEASVYFLVSEALTNVAKHAQASRATVTVAVHGDQLTVEVSDDGVGGASLDGGGSGLRGLADRVAALEGRFELGSEPGAGTTLRATVPLRPATQDESEPASRAVEK